MSTIKVDTIQKADGTSQIGIDKIGGVASAGTIAVIAEGGTNTTNLAQGLCKCWINFDGSAGSIAAADSFNSSGLTDNGSGDYTIAFTNDFGNANYACGNGSVNAGSSRITGLSGTNNAYAAGSAREIFSVTIDGESDAATPDNANPVRLAYFGDLA